MQITAVEKGYYWFPSIGTVTKYQYGWRSTPYSVQAHWSLPPVTHYRQTPTVSANLHIKSRQGDMKYYTITLSDGTRRELYEYVPVLKPRVGDTFYEKTAFGLPVYMKINDAVQYSNYVLGAGGLAFAAAVVGIGKLFS